jgi:anti-sigma regulatory factor (Ser/Thr protein kinase)
MSGNGGRAIHEHNGEVELRFPARAEHLALVRVVVTAIAESNAGLDGARLDDLRLLVSEACANAIEAYNRRGRPGAPVRVRCTAQLEHVIVEVHDDAGGFDPDALEPHPPVEAPERLHHERGLGVPLMRTLADQAEFRREGDGTTVRLVVGPRGT